LVPTILLSTAGICTEIEPAWLEPITVSRRIRSASVLLGELCQVTSTWFEALILPTQLKSRRSAWKLALSPSAWSITRP